MLDVIEFDEEVGGADVVGEDVGDSGRVPVPVVDPNGVDTDDS